MTATRKCQVVLTDEQRGDLERVARDGKTPARKARYARLLLHADSGHADGRRSDAWIADALGLHVNTVARLRHQFAAGGVETVFGRKRRQTPPVAPKIDGKVEAHLIAMLCGPAPEGRARWTLRLLAGEMKSRGFVTSVSVETVRKALKKMRSSPG